MLFRSIVQLPEDSNHLGVPKQGSRLNSTVIITDVEDDVSCDYPSTVPPSNNLVYLGQSGEINKIAKKQLKKEEAFQRRCNRRHLYNVRSFLR